MYLSLLVMVVASASVPDADASAALAAPIVKRGQLDTSPAKCARSSGVDIVVCGNGNNAYRIEPSVLAADRAAQSARDNAPNAGESEGATCAVGPRGCPGVLPVTQMALVVAQALVRAANGDDWREGLRTSPDAYRLYRDNQAKEARRPQIGIGLGVRN